MKGSSGRTTELEWTDPRDGRTWRVRTYWSGDIALGAEAGFQTRDPHEKTEGRIIFLPAEGLDAVGEAHGTRNRGERTVGELSERDLMDLLDQARKDHP